MRLIKGNIIEAKECGKLSTYENGCIILDDNNIILDVTSSGPVGFSGEIIDWGDNLILQAFCDMHLHAPQFPMVGIGLDKPLLEWLETYTFPNESSFSDPVYARAIYSSLADTLIKNGTTRIAAFSSLHRESTLILMEELEKRGISGYVGKVNMDRNGLKGVLEETTSSSEEDTLTWLEEAKRFKRIKPIITPRFTPSCTSELSAWLGKIAREKNLPVQSHLSENRDEIKWVKELEGCEYYYEAYDKYGLLKEKTIMAHCVHLSDKEIEVLRDKGALIAHCPSSNYNLMSGTAPVRRMLSLGAHVALGSDIAAGSSPFIYRVMQEAITASKIRYMYEEKESNPLSIEEAYYLATTSGALYFGDKPGFGKGNRLNAIVVDDSSFSSPNRRLMLKERLERAVYNMNEKSIVKVYS